MPPLSKREATTILSALAAGVVPRAGLRHIAVGRLKEVSALKQDLDQVASGGATVRFVVGRYGSGKSFLLQLIRSYALESKFVVADMDFSPDRRLYGTSDEGLATYRELVRNISTMTRPDGNALPAIIEKWISTLQSRITAEKGLAPDSPEFINAVKSAIHITLDEMEGLVHGYDFGLVIGAYYQGYIQNDDTMKSNAIRWLRGEFNNRTEAYQALKVRSIIDSDNYYDYLKILARFVREVGYAGLMVCFDEGAYLYKISNSISRKNNYEQILTILNDCLQGKASYISIIFSGTPEFIEDQRRGLYSYEALRSRLSSNRFASAELQDFSGPVLRLPSLTLEEIFVLLQKVRDIYNGTGPVKVQVTDPSLTAFMEDALNRVGAREFSTPRELIRDFVSAINILVQHPERTWDEIVGGISPSTPIADPVEAAIIDEATIPAAKAGSDSVGDDPLDRFSDFKVN